MEIILEAIVNRDGNYELINYGFIHNGNINDFDFDGAVKEFESNSKEARVVTIEIKL